MTSNFRFISYNENYEPLLKQVKDNPDDWKAVSTYENTGGNKNPYGFLPLIMAVVNDEFPEPKNTEMLRPSPMFSKYTAATDWLKSKGFKTVSRCAFFRIQVGGGVGRHIDEGTYYLNKDRYHFALQGRYRYECGGEEHIIEPGTFFWFDNKQPHFAENISDVERITLVFDVPHSPDNP